MKRFALVAVLCCALVAAGIAALQAWRGLRPGDAPSIVDPPTPPRVIQPPLRAISDPGAAAKRDEAERAASETAAEERDRLDRTVWAKEVQAQEYEETFVRLWDGMRARAEDQHVLLAAFPFTRLRLRAFGDEMAHRWGFTRRTQGDPWTLDQAGWRALVDGFVAQGWRVEHVEFHHAAFDLDEGAPARSKISLKLFVARGEPRERVLISGSLAIVWSRDRDASGLHLVDTIDATELAISGRQGAEAFTEAAHFSPEDVGVPRSTASDPLLVVDVDGDGKDDIALPQWNTLLINTSTPGHIAFRPRRLCDQPLATSAALPVRLISSGVIADFTGDGIPDLALVGCGIAPTLFVGAAGGRFPEAGKPMTDLAADALTLPLCMTAGDVDGDGRLDLWIGQYRRPADGPKPPDPYWDADDGYPSFLLLNAGEGRFVDATERSGLTTKRHRRNYSASLVDLDEDGHVDLLTVNDFSGPDVWRNRGDGTFEDITASALDQRQSYGMSHCFADVDGDGTLDLYVTGMASTTARRLTYMKLERPDFPEHGRMRMAMGYGNRLFLGGADHRFKQASFNEQVARTGWAWGCTALDVDNAGLVDLYVANGFISRNTAKDYCTRWWTHDIYAGSEPVKPDLVQTLASELAGISWNGFEHKALLMNEGGSFVEAAYPLGMGHEWDERAVVGADLDGDGLVDLVTVEMRRGADPYTTSDPVLHIFRNQSVAPANHWIAVRVPERPGHASMCARIVVEAGGRKRPAVIVSGDSFRAQHPACKHFGLGTISAVDAVEVRWAGGARKRVEHPPVDAELVVSP